MAHRFLESTSPRLLAMGVSLGAALHASAPLLRQWLWCRSPAADVLGCLVALFEQGPPRHVSWGLSALALLAWTALALGVRVRQRAR